MNKLFLLFLPGIALAGSLPPPNVVLFMADDMGMGDTSAYQFFTGNSDSEQIATPQIERLARLGVLFTDAHTPSSRCTATRYGLLTGRYAFRSRLKHFVLFGSQGDPLIEPGRPTLGTLFQSAGYSTGLVGKWHVGLRYNRVDGKPASAWEDADLTKPLADCPLDHGFDYCRYTSRSHGTSGPDAGLTRPKTGKNKCGGRNTPLQIIGPGHLHGRKAIGANGNGKQLVKTGSAAYDLHSLGSRHASHAAEFIKSSVEDGKPFFLYYPSNSNHGPYTPDKAVSGFPVAGASKSKAGEPMKIRYDYIYENDAALGGLLQYLNSTEDPRRPGNKLIDNTIVIFTSDNGAEIPAKTATGPFRSQKGSAFEGGHRVPFIVSWPAANVGDGNPRTPGKVSSELVALQDLYATFSSILGKCLPDPASGQRGAEDSFNVWAAWQGKGLPSRPLFHNDHKESKPDPAAVALRLDSPEVDGKVWEGQWKLFFDSNLVRLGQAKPYALYNLAEDLKEEENLVGDPAHQPLVRHLTRIALLNRNTGGHRLASLASKPVVTFDWTAPGNIPGQLGMELTTKGGKKTLSVGGLGISGGSPKRVDNGESLQIRFAQDVLIQAIAIRAGNEGSCGGFVQLGDHSPLAIYCLDADNDSRDQHGVLSDLGVLPKGQTLLIDTSPHYGSENPGSWLLERLVVRPL